mmetsp:Transcript_2138/g.9066  ORF Transcript_2138/g.9066 Transcript_2138/m.9066 type:complete len:208 (-) Transcript_2138:461-1084(-)
MAWTSRCRARVCCAPSRRSRLRGSGRTSGSSRRTTRRMTSSRFSATTSCERMFGWLDRNATCGVLGLVRVPRARALYSSPPFDGILRRLARSMRSPIVSSSSSSFSSARPSSARGSSAPSSRDSASRISRAASSSSSGSSTAPKLANAPLGALTSNASALADLAGILSPVGGGNRWNRRSRRVLPPPPPNPPPPAPSSSAPHGTTSP